MLFANTRSVQTPSSTSFSMPAVLSLPKTFVAKRTTPSAITTSTAPAAPSVRLPPNVEPRRLRV
jgi:hypothetical protein